MEKWREACFRFRFNFVKPTIASTIDATGKRFLRAFVVIYPPRAQPYRDESYHTLTASSNWLQKERSFWAKFIYLSHSVYITFGIIMPFCKLCHMPFHKAPFHSFTLLLQRRQKEADFQLLPVPHTVLSISFIQQIRPLENDVRKFEL